MKGQERVDEIRCVAEECFASGKLYCSEAVVKTINDALGKPYGDDVVKLASGFPVGIGKAGCLCGAVSGGVMALGMVYGRCEGEAMQEEMFTHSANLHDRIREIYKSTCCRVITRDFEFTSPERKAHCIKITGEVAAYVAEVLVEQGKL